MREERKEFQTAEVEIIKFDKKDDIKTDLSSIALGGEGMIDSGIENS